MYLQDGTRDHFLRFLEREFPAMRLRFDKLYAKKYPPERYRKDVQAMVRVLQDRYGLRKRKRRTRSRRPRRLSPGQNR